MSFRAPNHTQTPNELFALIPDMGETELKVTLVVVRDTFGWQAGGAATARSLTELQQLTGLSRQGVLNGLQAGLKRGTLYKTQGPKGKAAYGLVVNPVDQSTPLTSPPSRPELVNPVDQTGQTSRPGAVYPVDHHRPDASPPSEQKQAPERQQKDRERQERNTTAGTSTPRGPAAAEPGASEPGGASGTTAPPGAILVDATTGHGTPDPGNAGREQAHGTEQVPGAALAALTAALAPLKPLDLIAEYAVREGWLSLPADRIRQLNTEARSALGRKFRGALIEALDAEVRPTTSKPTTSTVNDLVRSRLKGVQP